MHENEIPRNHCMFGFAKKYDELSSLVAGCQKGDRKAMRIVYENFAENMNAISYRYVNDENAAEEIVSSGFIKAFEKLDQLDDFSKFGGWLKRIIVNLSLDYLRTNKLKFDNIEDHSYKLVGGQHEEPLAKMGLEELLELIESLPEGYKVVFNLFEIEGYSHHEIAEMLGITVSTSKSQLMKSKRWLREKINAINEFEYHER